MGCIEIFAIGSDLWYFLLINRNMGCIEIYVYSLCYGASSKINRNMGCIEIEIYDMDCDLMLGLIETWDVLKFLHSRYCYFYAVINRNMGCIEIRLTHVHKA